MIAPARQVAYKILLQIATTDAHSDELLRSREVDALSAQDRNLATTLVMGTLRWQLALDARIRGLLARPGTRLSPEVATALRMGAYQLLYLDRVPAHAVIHDSVELVKRSIERGASGMVNAVLRKVGQGAELRQPGSAAALQAHPSWMVDRWSNRYGRAVAERICWWNQEPAPTALRLVDPAAELSGLETEPGIFLSCARRVLRGDPGRSDAVLSGCARIQDEASQLVAEIAAAEPDRLRAPAGKVLDTCAAPGGKTAILLERLPRASVTAIDVSRKRLESMRRLSRPVHDRLLFEAADAAKLDLRPEWDRILCDVPCSGTGTMARNPEIRLRLTEGDLARQQIRQLAILRAALPGLVPSGRLVYSSCSLEPEENEAVVAAALRELPGYRVLPIGSILDHLAEGGVLTGEGRDRLRSATEGDFLRTLPGVHACDGFFAAVIERVG